MARDRQSAGICKACGRGTIACLHNRFDNGVLVIDSWEHRCPDCGARETQAYRSDDPPATAAADPLVCPYCSRRGE